MKNKIITAKFNSGIHQSKMRIEKNAYVPVADIKNEHAHAFPVIHIDYKGRILYANKASFPLLGEWNCIANEYLPEKITAQFPGLLNLDAGFELEMTTKSFQFYLDVIGFREAGYIGLYGFLTVENTEQNKINGVSLALSV
ncbi:hypothetical protein BH11BAC1_BH11BAC1_22080 [soil metagenome]